MRLARNRQGRQIPVEADEFQLREDSDQPGGESCRTAMRSITAEQALELLTDHPVAGPKTPVQGNERSSESVLQLVHLLYKA